MKKSRLWGAVSAIFVVFSITSSLNFANAAVVKRRVVMMLVGSVLATMVGIKPAHALVFIPIELVALDLRSTAPVSVLLGPGFAPVMADVQIVLDPTSSQSLGLHILFVNSADIPTIGNGDSISLDSNLDLFFKLRLTDVDPLADFNSLLPRDPSDPNIVELFSSTPLFLDTSGTVPADLSRPNLGLTRQLPDRGIVQIQPINLGDLTGDGIDNTLDITSDTLFGGVASDGLGGDGRWFTDYDGVVDELTFDVNPTFSVNLTGTFTIAETIVIPASAVPVPAAVWLFGSGLLGLIGIARKRKPL